MIIGNEQAKDCIAINKLLKIAFEKDSSGYYLP
jgi:hypothetical protein